MSRHGKIVPGPDLTCSPLVRIEAHASPAGPFCCPGTGSQVLIQNPVVSVRILASLLDVEHPNLMFSILFYATIFQIFLKTTNTCCECCSETSGRWRNVAHPSIHRRAQARRPILLYCSKFDTKTSIIRIKFEDFLFCFPAKIVVNLNHCVNFTEQKYFFQKPAISGHLESVGRMTAVVFSASASVTSWLTDLLLWKKFGLVWDWGWGRLSETDIIIIIWLLILSRAGFLQRIQTKKHFLTYYFFKRKTSPFLVCLAYLFRNFMVLFFAFLVPKKFHLHLLSLQSKFN